MSIKVTAREVGASVADLGVLLPITAALVVINGVDPVAAFGLAGALFVVSGLFYRVPVPVQPIKAAAAIAIATGASPRVLAAAGLVLGLILLALAVTGAWRLLVRVFPKPIIRGNQLGVGILLVLIALPLAQRGTGSHGVAIAVFAGLVGVLLATAEGRIPIALVLVAGGIAWSIATGARATLDANPALPGFGLPTSDQMLTALTLLVIPQLPLTLGNAIVGTADLEREYFGQRARRVTERNLLVTCGLGNVAVGALGGMPLCHGSSGATAYHRFGASTGGVNLVIGGALLAAGLLFGQAAVSLFALIPFPVLAALLASTGLSHAQLVTDQRGTALAIAVAMGIVGGLTRNLTWAMAVGLPAYVVLIGSRKVLARAR